MREGLDNTHNRLIEMGEMTSPNFKPFVPPRPQAQKIISDLETIRKAQVAYKQNNKTSLFVIRSYEASNSATPRQALSDRRLDYIVIGIEVPINFQTDNQSDEQPGPHNKTSLRPHFALIDSGAQRNYIHTRVQKQYESLFPLQPTESTSILGDDVTEIPAKGQVRITHVTGRNKYYQTCLVNDIPCDFLLGQQFLSAHHERTYTPNHLKLKYFQNSDWNVITLFRPCCAMRAGMLPPHFEELRHVPGMLTDDRIGEERVALFTCRMRNSSQICPHQLQSCVQEVLPDLQENPTETDETPLIDLDFQ